MNIIDVDINKLIPYAKNPRKNDEAVEPVANSIREFGFRVPIVIDKENNAVCGHTRLKAAKKLGMKTVPCIIADDLSEEQIKGFRLADNKVGELAEWDFDLLGEELDGIFDIDMSEFGFELSIENEQEPAKIEDKELKPYSKVHYLITIDVNDNDKIIDLISELRSKEGVEVEKMATAIPPALDGGLRLHKA